MGSDNARRFKYLGSVFEAGGGHMTDVSIRIAMATKRFGQLRHLWQDKLNLWLRLYKSCVCSILTYGSETWRIDEQTRKTLNGANASMVSVLTGKTPHQDVSSKWKTFDIVAWIRDRRLQWLGHILRMGPERKLKQTVFEMFKHRSEGDMLMDAPEYKSWKGICTQDRKRWRA